MSVWKKRRLGVLVLVLAGILLAGIVFSAWVLDRKGMNHWLPAYIGWLADDEPLPADGQGPLDIIFLMVDHYEPTKAANARAWIEGYPAVAGRFTDAHGYHPRYSWFFPIEKYEINSRFVEGISSICARGFGEIEVHLHHHSDTEETLRATLREGVRNFQRHGACITVDGETAFGFVHGNWALDNSVLVDGRDRCGVDNEMLVLADEGCYADFTFPSSGSMAQPNKINAIYYAVDDPAAPKSYDEGFDVTVGTPARGDLMIFQGPLMINWSDWRHVIYPAIEDGQLQAGNPPLPFRVDKWIEAGVHVRGRPEWRFVKVFTHGASPKNWKMLFDDGGFEMMFERLVQRYNDGEAYRLHFVTAREAYNMVKAAEAGLSGDPSQYRDYLIKPYRNTVETADGAVGEATRDPSGGQDEQ